jgi:hypothetical protein
MAHRTTADGHVSNEFDDGDPTVPRQGTLLTALDMTMLQEELCGLVEESGTALNSGNNQQLRDLLMNLTTQQTATATKTFVGTDAQTGDLEGRAGIVATGGTGEAGDVVKGGIGGKFTGGEGGESLDQDGGIGVQGIGGTAGSGTGNPGIGGRFVPGDADTTAVAIECDGKIDLSGCADIAAPVLNNEISGRAIHKAHVSMTLNNSVSPTVDADDAYNVASVSAAGGATDAISITFSKAFATGALPVPCVTLGYGGSGAIYVPRISGRSTTVLQIQILDGAGVVQDPTDAASPINGMTVHVIVEGKQG